MAQRYAVDIVAKVAGTSGVDKFQRSTDKLDKSVSRLNGNLPKATNNVRGFGRDSRGAAAGLSALNKAAVKIAAVIATIKGATFLFQYGRNRDAD